MHIGLKINLLKAKIELKIRPNWTKNNDTYRTHLRTLTWRDIYVIQAKGNIESTPRKNK
jgi:hypothetical protein